MTTLRVCAEASGAAETTARAATDASRKRRMKSPPTPGGLNSRRAAIDLSPIQSASASQSRFLVDHRDVGHDDFPADVRKTHPGLALATDHVPVAHLVDQGHRGNVAAQRDDVEPVALLLGAGARRPGDAMSMDPVEAVPVLVVGEADGVRAVPERAVEHVDVLVDQGLLVTFEQSTDLFDHFRDVRRQILHAASIALATATSVASLPRGPMIDRPTGSPSTVAPGRLTCGWPACPPCAQRQVMRSRSGSSTDSGWPTGGAGNGGRGRARVGRAGGHTGRHGP